jgi:hypothetical protein
MHLDVKLQAGNTSHGGAFCSPGWRMETEALQLLWICYKVHVLQVLSVHGNGSAAARRSNWSGTCCDMTVV